MQTFGGIPMKYADRDRSKVWLQSIPYDGTSTWGKGADLGFDYFLDAASNMELFDIETGTEVYKNGIHILPEISICDSPEEMFSKIYTTTKRLLKENKFLTFFGGEHSISIGIIKAFYEAYPDLTVLQLDAHADLRPNYQGTKFNHACALYDASQNTNLVQVGIRSMARSEIEVMDGIQSYTAEDMILNTDWVETSIEQMSENVYITFDFDVLDPSIMPSTGTPEPGGIDWYEAIYYLKEVFRQKTVVGFDLVEFCPIRGMRAPNFLAAKLYYKMLTYKYYHDSNWTC